MNTEMFNAIRQRGEGLTVEFKRCGNGIQNDTYETVCSFLNRFGGDIFMGVEDDGTVIGLPENSIPSLIKNFISMTGNGNFLSPSFYLEPEDVILEGRHVLHVYVPPSSDVHSLKGICYDRGNDADVKVSGTDKIAEMYIRKHNLFTEKQIFPCLTKNELRLDLLPKVRQMALSKQPGHPWGEMPDDDLLKSAGLWGTDYAKNTTGYNAAAVLLLGKDDVIRNIFSAYETDALVRRVNLDRYDDREIVRTNLIESYSALTEFGKKHLPDKFYLDENSQNISLRGHILREMIANVLIHREFSSSYPAKFVIEKDRMYVENANKAVRHGMITPENLQPMPKNPIIAAFFREIGLADKLGSGVRNLFKFTKIYSGQEPVFLEEDIFRITVPLDDEYAPAEAAAEKTDRKNVSTVRDKVRDKFGISSGQIIEWIQQQPEITARQIAEHLGITERAVQKQISNLRKNNIIDRIGSNKTGYWLVLDLPEENKNE